MGKIRRAILSVFDKTGIAALAKELVAMDIEILSSGGTAAALRAALVPVTEVSAVTGFPEMMDGRVKTLHPAIHGPLLADRSKAAHLEALSRHGMAPIDLVVLNLYPFETGLASGRPHDDLVELIDIGGPTMLRAAAKNCAFVAAVVDPADYAAIVAELRAQDGGLTASTRRKLAAKAFRRVAALDAAIAGYLDGVVASEERQGAPAPEAPARLLPETSAEREFPHTHAPRYTLVQTLRYGENPHQRAALYRCDPPATEVDLAGATVHQGKSLSYNNFVDIDSCLRIARDLDEPAAVIVKHNNPCGAATAETLVEAFRAAHACDPLSAFGGIIGFNRTVDAGTMQVVLESGFIECLVGPGYTADALHLAVAKKNVRVLSCTFEAAAAARRQTRGLASRTIAGGLLLQDEDDVDENQTSFHCVSTRVPTAAEERSLRFAWRIAKSVISNAIVFTRGTATVGVGAGQMSRVDSVALAARKAGERSRGAVLASDAFFPFRDGIDAAAAAGITAIIEPGGSVRDDEVIDAANEHGLALLFTGARHFRH
ncbi:MAG: bifunctional phosphoribosylaminoimidazolecarboxamide formyltransferase/IMP cyclohydrolase [Candidatus Schekmanbacteria bacterium]|nr:bifunctional phosphoribosylaminoimidazolecarboxamide formyltransferase/IMP cyclohydrolase [Candidatus Schekmanbacteria bacterium]